MPVDVQEPSAEVIVVEESVLQTIATDIKAIRTGMVSQFDALNRRIDRLERERRNDEIDYRVLADAVDHARLVALRVATRLDNIEEMEKQRTVRSRMDTLPGPGDTDRPPSHVAPELVPNGEG